MAATTAMVESGPSVEILYRTDGERLWRALYAFCGDEEIAGDALNEAFAQLIRRGDGVRDRAAWVWRAAFAVARGALLDRRTALRATASTDQPIAVLDRYADPDLMTAVRQLPDAQRAAVILFYFADLPIRQIASRLGTNSLAVRANLSRGRRRLRSILGDTDA